jgi:hypothetical protein
MNLRNLRLLLVARALRQRRRNKLLTRERHASSATVRDFEDAFVYADDRKRYDDDGSFESIVDAKHLRLGREVQQLLEMLPMMNTGANVVMLFQNVGPDAWRPVLCLIDGSK